MLTIFWFYLTKRSLLWIQYLEIQKPGHAGQGALIGLAAGIVASAILASEPDEARGAYFLIAMGFVGIPLTILGTLVGSAVH